MDMVERKRFHRGEIAAQIAREATRASDEFSTFASAHEGLAVLWEEFEELKAEVWKKKASRDSDAMRKEAIQIGAMAIRFITDVVEANAGKEVAHSSPT